MIGKIHAFLRQIRKNYMRNKILKTCASCGSNLHVNGKSEVNYKTELGNNVNFNGMTIIGNGRVVIGNNFHSAQNCCIITQNHDYDYGDSIPYDSEHSIEQEVIIEDNVWLGYGVIVLPGSHICEGAIIQAGSVVRGTIPACSIGGGESDYSVQDEKYRAL